MTKNRSSNRRHWLPPQHMLLVRYPPVRLARLISSNQIDTTVSSFARSQQRVIDLKHYLFTQTYNLFLVYKINNSDRMKYIDGWVAGWWVSEWIVNGWVCGGFYWRRPVRLHSKCQAGIGEGDVNVMQKRIVSSSFIHSPTNKMIPNKVGSRMSWEWNWE